MFAHDSTVLIIGAGPVGLAAAITLTRLGTNVMIVDASSAPHKGARAAVVHSRTLEVLETVGLAKVLVEQGTPVSKVTLRGTTQDLFHIDFSLIKEDTQFPFILLISQEVVEKTFVNVLSQIGGTVYLNKKVVDIQPIESSEKVEVIFEDGTRIQTNYIIGADGIHSITRKLAGIGFTNPFTNKPYDDPHAAHAFNLILSDLFIKEPLPEKILPNTFSAHVDDFFFLIPLKTADDTNSMFWRVGFGFPNTVELPKHPTEKDIQELINERNPWKSTPINISSLLSASRYRVRVAQADTYHSKIGHTNVLLAGDAAHIHSPVGGQGMNLGICDAVAAAQAIHTHLHSSSPSEERDAVLISYSQRRHAIGRRVIGMTRGMTLVVISNSRWKRLLRNALLRILDHFKSARAALVWRMSGLINRDG